MRLIDADELKEQLFQLKCLYKKSAYTLWLEVMKIVNEQPTIDEKENMK